MDFSNNLIRWYKKPSGVIIIIFGVIALGLVFGFLALLSNYWWNIRAGRGDLIRDRVYAGFTTAGKNTVSGTSLTREELETADDPYLGSADGPIVIVQFIDFQCPNSLAAQPILQQVLGRYGQKVKLIVRDFPIDSLYYKSSELSSLAYCAKEQNAYWGVHNWLFAERDRFSEGATTELINEAVELFGLKKDILLTCLNSSRPKTEVNKDYADGYNAGVGGTPTFFVNGEKIEGVVPFEVWDGYLKNIK